MKFKWLVISEKLPFEVILPKIAQHFLHAHAEDAAEDRQFVIGDNAGVVLDFADHLLVDIHAEGLHFCRELCLRKVVPDTVHFESFGDDIVAAVELQFFHTEKSHQYNVFYLTLAYILCYNTLYKREER